MNGLVIAGTSSGVGKTVTTLAVIRALQSAGKRVQPAKAGPDFIDPSHHEQLTDQPSRTLDTWLQGSDGLRRNYHRGTGDVCVVEGMMGLYDGECASTAMVAEALNLPVVLVVDASAGMESVAATALGFRTFADRLEREIEVAGVIAQQAHGGTHEDGIREALPAELSYLGRIPPNDALEIPERHLGLHMGEEAGLDLDAIDEASETLRTEALREVARPAKEPESPGEAVDPSDATIAVAQDRAFRFFYPATVERLRERGTVEPFSPLTDDLPACDGVYLPGGYPELHADELAESTALETIADRAADSLPIFGECGGLMALAESLRTADGDTYEMAGVLPAAVRMHDRFQALDHVELRATSDTLTASAGETIRGHEFHYSSATVGSDARFAFECERGIGIDGEHDGLIEYETVGTYAHVHPESGAFDAFLEQCEDDRN